MNFTLKPELVEKSAKIDVGIRYLQGKMMYIINRIPDKNNDSQRVLQKYMDDIEKIGDALSKFIQQQEEFSKMLADNENEFQTINQEIEALLEKHNLKLESDENFDSLP